MSRLHEAWPKDTQHGLSLDLRRDLIEHGLRPDDITLAALMDICVADSDYTIVNEIGDLIVASHLELPLGSKGAACRALASQGIS